MKWQQNILLALALFFSQVIQAQIAPFHIRFTVGTDAITVASTDLSLSPVNNHFQIRSLTRASGIFSLFNKDELIEVSEVDYKNNRYYPIEYQWINNQKNKTLTVNYNYDYPNKKIIHHKQDKDIVLPMQQDSYDPASIILAVADWVKRDFEQIKTQKQSRQFDYHDHNRAWIKIYQTAGEESLDLPWGELNAIKVEQIDHNEDTRITIWIAPEQGFIPVQIEQRKNGKLIARMELEQIF